MRTISIIVALTIGFIGGSSPETIGTPHFWIVVGIVVAVPLTLDVIYSSRTVIDPEEMKRAIRIKKIIEG